MNENDIKMRAELLLLDIANIKSSDKKLTLDDAKKDQDWDKAIEIVKQRFNQWKDLS